MYWSAQAVFRLKDQEVLRWVRWRKEALVGVLDGASREGRKRRSLGRSGSAVWGAAEVVLCPSPAVETVGEQMCPCGLCGDEKWPEYGWMLEWGESKKNCVPWIWDRRCWAKEAGLARYFTSPQSWTLFVNYFPGSRFQGRLRHTRIKSQFHLLSTIFFFCHWLSHVSFD